MKNNLIYIIQDWLAVLGVSGQLSEILSVTIIIATIAVLSWLANYLTKNILLKIVTRLVKKTKTQLDDILLEKKVFHKLSHFAPAIIIYFTIEFAFPDAPGTVAFLKQLTFIYMLFVCLLVINAFLSAINSIYDITIGKNKGTSIKSYIQVLKIIITIIFILIMLSLLLNKEIGYFLTGMGAMTAIFMLVFKDSILGLVGGIQLTTNDMIRIGDWIEMPSRNADGDVIEVTLNTVKIRNFDMTISTIPTYALVSESYRNWRGMSESGGRRIMRNIYIDQKSVKFCTQEMLDKFSEFYLLKDYIATKITEIEEYNKKHGLINNTVVNGRKLTNLGMFRQYIKMYLKNNQNINQDMLSLVRHLAISEKGIPMQVYTFSRLKSWPEYEAVQADIFDHLLAIIPEFELKVFQLPTGEDIKEIASLYSK